MIVAFACSAGSASVFRDNPLLPVVMVFWASVLYGLLYLFLLRTHEIPVPWVSMLRQVVVPGRHRQHPAGPAHLLGPHPPGAAHPQYGRRGLVGSVATQALGSQRSTAEAPRETRLVAFYVAIGVAFLILLGQLWYVQIASGAQYRQRAEVNRIRVISEKPQRGVIYDRAGRQLARNVPSFTVSLRAADLPRDAQQQAAVIARLGQLIEMPAEEITAIVQERCAKTPSPRCG